MITIGRKDKVDLPEFALFEVNVKVDTGAYGCALHCHKIELVLRNGKEVLSFAVLDPDHPEYEGNIFYSENYDNKIVKNSNGDSQNRYTIKTEVILFNKREIVEFSLTDRSKMKYPILLGRKFISNRFLVDVTKKDLSFNQKNEK
ncbi:MAG: ATP-dependent zinc protease [Cyclobacteriaceae bacterium]